MRDDHSPTLRAFHLIARYGSFTRAAADMEVTASALSQTMRQLEQRVGVRLLQRTTRKVGLTEAGRQFLERITPALGAIDGALDELRQHGDRPAGTLRVTVPEIVLDWLMAPMQADFLRRWPDITLDIDVTGGLVDLVAAGYDCGIRLGERVARDMVAVPLGGKVRSIVAAAPAYLDQHGRPQHPRELQQHACIRNRYVSSGAIYRWEFAQRGRWFDIDVGGPLIVNAPSLAIRAALDGLGLTHTLQPAVHEHLTAGRLETVLDTWLPPYDGFYLYYPSRFQVPPKLRAFIDFLRERMALQR
ncbi:LysR family transcriptional regulator [Dyella sp. 2RAB6]|uniref:LysR family transcriptional regulator n=1 Tax=Dyella sp. 2RAB6 TaxID=3232992 RepID=UPI003F906E1C